VVSRKVRPNCLRTGKIVGIITAVAALIVAVVTLLTYLDSRARTTPTASEKSVIGSWRATDEGDHSFMTLNTTTAGTDTITGDVAAVLLRLAGTDEHVRQGPMLASGRAAAGTLDRP